MKINEHWRADDQDFIIDPYPSYKVLLNESPVFKSPSGDYVFLSHEMVKEGLMSKNLRVDVRSEWITRLIDYAQKKGKDFSPLKDLMRSMLVQLNPPEHSQFRMLLTKSWPSRDYISKQARKYSLQIIKSLPKEGNLVELIARKLSLLIINDIIGTDEFDDTETVNDGIQIQSILNPYLTLKELEQINDASVRTYQRFTHFYHAVDESKDSLTTRIKSYKLTHPEDDFDPISLLQFLWIAGLENSTSLITTCLNLILTNKSLLNELIDDQKLQNFINEVLRLHPPVQLVGRSSKNATEIRGIKIPANSVITLCIGAANRDPKVFNCPDELNLERPNYQHVAFGHGIHHCIGNQLALIETFHLIKEILPLIPSLSLTSDPVYKSQLTIRSIKNLEFKYNGRQ